MENPSIICHNHIFHNGKWIDLLDCKCGLSPTIHIKAILQRDSFTFHHSCRTVWNSTELLMKAVTNAVRSCLTTLCRTAFYTVHRCFGKSDAFIISLVPMVTKTDVSLWKSLVFVWFRQQWSRLYLPVRPFACVNSQRKDEANANTACDLFVRFRWQMHDGGSSDFSRPRTYIIPLNVALWWQRSDPFIKLLNCGAASRWLNSSRVGRHHSTWWVWPWCCLHSLCDVLLVSDKGWYPRGK